MGRSAEVTADQGWHIDPTTLREVVTDPARLSAQLGTATRAERVWLLRVLGDLEGSAAEGEALLDATGPAPERARIRPLLLLGHTRSWQRAWEQATELHVEALGLSIGTRWEAVARQHWGKCLFEQRRYVDAADQFAGALELREAADAAAELVGSSRLALHRARRLVAGGG